MSDFTTPDQQVSAVVVGGIAGGESRTPLTYTEARLRWQSSKEQTTESRMDYLSAKNFGNSESVFIAAVVLAEAYCLEVESHDAFEELVVEENWRLIQAERESADADVLKAAIQSELEHAS